MSFIQRFEVAVTTDGAQAAEEYTPPITGKISQVIYTKTDFTDGVDFTITAEDTARNIWVELNVNASAAKAPRIPTHDPIGAASLYAGSGEGVEDQICLANERVKIVIAAGGATKSGTFHVIVE